MPGQACVFKTFRASLTLVPAGYIGPADPTLGRNLPLGARRPLIQSIPQGDDQPLPRGQAGLDTAADFSAGVPRVQLLQQVVVHGKYVHQRQGVPIPTGLQRLGQRDLALELALGTEVHQDLIFNAPAGVGRQAHIFIRLERRDPFDQADGPNGDQVILIPGLGVVLFHNVGHQPQVVALLVQPAVHG